MTILESTKEDESSSSAHKFNDADLVQELQLEIIGFIYDVIRCTMF